MVTKFNIFEKIQWKENYIVSYPSGEIVYYEREIDILYLLEKNIVYIDRHAKGHKYSCSDFLLPKVKEHFHRIKGNEIRSIVVRFLKSIGLEDDHYKFNDDFSVDVYTAISMEGMKLVNIPVKFNKCFSDFNCSHNLLRSLQNCPTEVHGNFNCSYNRLKNLLFGPKIIYRGTYNCSHNELETLQGAPLTAVNFDCSDNYLLDLEKLPIVTGKLITTGNLLNDKN